MAKTKIISLGQLPILIKTKRIVTGGLSHVLYGKPDSKLIELILLDVQLPIIYTGFESSGVLSPLRKEHIVCWINSFLVDRIELQGMDMLPQYNGLTIDTLPEAERTKILDTSLTFSSIPTRGLYLVGVLNSISDYIDAKPKGR